MTKPQSVGSMASVRHRLATSTCLVLLASLSATLPAQAPIAPGHVVALRLGDGAAALGSAAAAVFLDEYTAAGSLVQTIALPTSAADAITNSGTATSEGFLNLSSNGQFLVHAGYRAIPGTASVVTSAAARVISRVALSGGIDTTTALTDAYLASSVRSVATVDGTQFWVGGTGSPTTSAGVRFVSGVGQSTSTQLSSTVTNNRVVNIFNGQLYTGSASGAFLGVSTVGTGLPTTSGQVTTLLPGFSAVTGNSTYDYFFADNSTLYVADDRTTTAGGIQKWVLSSGTWTLQYTLNPATGVGCRGLSGVVNGGTTTLYATTTQATGNALVSVTDAGPGAASPFTTVANAGTNRIFRGVRFIPVSCTAAQIASGGDPVPATVCAGAPASFTVSATGTPTIAFQWRKNLNPISGATTATFTIPIVTVGDGGSYDCMVTNGCGSATSAAATLTVDTAPTIDTPPASVSACEGTPASFTVSATGTAPLTFQWRKNGNPIGGATLATFSIGSVTNGDADTYDCVVTNGCGSATSAGATLDVTAPPAPSAPAPVVTCEGLGASFDATATGTGPITYQWRKDTNPISGATSPTFVIGSVTTFDAGAYDCVVSNGCGSVTSTTATLTVDVAPSVTSPRSPVTTCEGTTATFSVSASGTAPLSYQWRKDGNPIGGATLATFSIPAVIAADAGSYDCVVTNGCGSATSSAASLSVDLAPVVDTSPTGTVVTAGMPFSLSVSASGTAPLTYQWRKDSNAISGATLATFTVNAAAFADAGSYDCVVTNGCGQATSNAAAVTVVPANDLCTTAAPVTVGLVIGDNGTATTEPGLPLFCAPASRDVWYSFTNSTSCASELTLSLCAADGAGASFPAVLGAFTGGCGSLVLAACDAGSCGTAPSAAGGVPGGVPRLTLTAPAGVTYLISVSALGFAPGGSFTLAVITHSAVSETYGTSCDASAGTLNGTLPILGQVGCLSINGAAPDAPGLLLFSGPTAPPYAPFGSCSIYLAPAGIGIFLGITTDALGSWSFCSTIPNDPLLQCADVRFQAFLFTPTGFSLTNGLRLTLGT